MGPVLSFTLCCHHLEKSLQLLKQGPAFSPCTGPGRLRSQPRVQSQPNSDFHGVKLGWSSCQRLVWGQVCRMQCGHCGSAYPSPSSVWPAGVTGGDSLCFPAVALTRPLTALLGGPPSGLGLVPPPPPPGLTSARILL